MLLVHKFTFSPFQENTYLLYNEEGDCAIIDPGCYEKSEEDELRSVISEKNLTPTLLLNTHCHIDHVFGNQFVAKEYGLKPIIHPKEEIILKTVPRVAEMYGLNYHESPEPQFYQGNEINLGGETLKILFVPGHAPGHVAFYSADHEFVIAGDVLFKQSIGRTDLPGGNMETLLKSISQELFPLSDNTIVYPGHMENTTIGGEKRLNPFLQGLL